MRPGAMKREPTALARETWHSAALIIGAFGVMSLLTSLLLFVSNWFAN